MVSVCAQYIHAPIKSCVCDKCVMLLSVCVCTRHIGSPTCVVSVFMLLIICVVFTVQLDGTKSKEQLYNAVYEDVLNNIQKCL